ncbi:hypothetical protein CDAR_232411 [Caerostris darwini]|uniref:Transmembrane protein n=1 Tax=Caerostris darwini TaxID=1538125 RepID=A0AAV4W708_9ARAC|nr:hypothetical protein CDAR_232411 [Caerostris darwini]
MATKATLRLFQKGGSIKTIRVCVGWRINGRNWCSISPAGSFVFGKLCNYFGCGVLCALVLTTALLTNGVVWVGSLLDVSNFIKLKVELSSGIGLLENG